MAGRKDYPKEKKKETMSEAKARVRQNRIDKNIAGTPDTSTSHGVKSLDSGIIGYLIKEKTMDWLFGSSSIKDVPADWVNKKAIGYARTGVYGYVKGPGCQEPTPQAGHTSWSKGYMNPKGKEYPGYAPDKWAIANINGGADCIEGKKDFTDNADEQEAYSTTTKR